ncbi:acyl-CoA synthetase [Caulobacter vibrioides]|uniref:AMP-binding protein n=1 Tax=Caulobacter vibrioides TaxID=155892 RepID=UPI000BB51AD3|nr:AMP-binding protein [Caulobacter vibrioides]ATC25394.1 acyl-CoA synthetase [Caulobacter vibrioides]AZH13484.1 acyl-CoA synthetase [Caulobacter vibrioides]PLR13644.1 acyl-CoA synthetase [Caulobacter vibrioides]
MTPIDHVAFQARLQPGGLAAVELANGRRWTYAELDADIARAVGVLRRRGVGEGDRLAVLAKNQVLLVILHLACARLGAMFAPLNWRLSASELHALIEDADPAMIVGDTQLAAAGLDGVDLDVLRAEIDRADPDTRARADRERPSLILYTSGTSGRPKGALLSERNLDQTAINFGRLGKVTHESVFLVDAPMFHIIGLITSIRPAFLHGGAILVSDGFEPVRTLGRLGDQALGITHYFCVPQMAAMLRRAPNFSASALRGLTAVFTGGAPHPAADIRAWLAVGVPVVDGYGMSEAGTVFGMAPDVALIDARAGSAGLAMSSVATRIVDEQDNDCSPGVAGELLLKGDNVFQGYWRRLKETEQAFTADGWFRTGDIALADADGYHWLVDRKKDMFISGGENVYPAEIEAALADHPAILECAVVGVPDPRWGEVGHLVVTCREGAVLDLALILSHLEDRLARYKLPKALTLVAALPRTASGKIQKTVLRERLLAGDPRT